MLSSLIALLICSCCGVMYFWRSVYDLLCWYFWIPAFICLCVHINVSLLSDNLSFYLFLPLPVCCLMIFLIIITCVWLLAPMSHHNLVCPSVYKKPQLPLSLCHGICYISPCLFSVNSLVFSLYNTGLKFFCFFLGLYSFILLFAALLQ